MKTVSIVLALILLAAASMTLWAAEDGAALYKSKCAMCHGEKGEGKAAMNMPAVKGTKLTAEQIVTYLTKGEAGKKAPHANPISGINEAQAKAVADCVKTLK
jgi:mono/diheme cytochrome c family protein